MRDRASLAEASDGGPLFEKERSMQSRRSTLILAGAVSLAFASPALVQAEDSDRAVVLYGNGGGFSTLTNLDQAKTTDFKTGYNVGGGIGYQFNKYVAIRGTFTFARAEGRSTLVSSPIAGSNFNRFFYDGDIQVGYPLSSGVRPYVFVGGGALTIDRHPTLNEGSFTRGAGKTGFGLSYDIPHSNVGLFVQGTGWLYKWDRYGFDQTQFDTTWSGGLSYRFRL
jgi:hypothetical protein